MTNDRRLFYFYSLAYIGVFAALYGGYTHLSFAPSVLTFVRAAVGALGISFVFVVLTNRLLWRLPYLRRLLGVRIPYVHGRWEGYIRSSYSKHRVGYPVAVEFSQSLHTIRVFYFDEHAVMSSLIAGFVCDVPDGPAFLYCMYSNKPYRNETPGLRQHHGAMELVVTPSGRTIHGVYYNNPHERRTFGDVQLSFVGRRLFGSYERHSP